MSRATLSAMPPGEVRWTSEIHTDGELRFRLGREGDRLIAEWPGICTLRAERDGSSSELLPAPDADPELIDKLHSGLARALLRHVSGELTLHASAAAIGGRAIACVGESHAGKSTAVAELVVNHGAELVSDDTLAIVLGDHGAGVIPTEPVSWLLPESRRALGFDADETFGKVPIAPIRAAQGQVPLGALVMLVFDDDIDTPTLRRLRGHDALEGLVPSVVRFILDEPELHRRELEQLTRLVSCVPVYELARPYRIEQLAAASEALRALAEGRGKP
ncbi:ATP-binding protein [Pendulispora brunnea]|uniref:ATP-binding protein n=1 Tax=Pendulispora brunnea TaxID=2905690 RepID=A0ABZ2KL88_9BACT